MQNVLPKLAVFPSLSPSQRALGLVLLSTFGLALKGIWARLAYGAGASVQTVLFYRAALSLPLILVCAHVFSSRFESQKVPFRLSHLTIGVLMGAFFSVGMFCDFQAIYYLGAGVSRVVLFGYPLVVLVFDSLARRAIPSAERLLGFGVAWLGLLLVCGVYEQFAGGAGAQATTWEHLPWGLASLLFYAAYVFVSGRMSRWMGSSRLSLFSNLATSVVVMSVLFVQSGGELPSVGNGALVWVAVMVVVSTVVPYFLMMEGIRRLGAAQASLTSMVGPVITLVASTWVLAEVLSFAQVLGVVLTLVGVFGVQRLRSSTT